jgi:hypothetical protein
MRGLAARVAWSGAPYTLAGGRLRVLDLTQLPAGLRRRFDERGYPAARGDEMTEEQMLDYFQKNGIPHRQVGGKLMVDDASTLPGGLAAYFNDEGFFVDAGKKSVEKKVQESVAEEGLAAEPVKPGPEPETEPKKTTKKAPTKSASRKK